jgi:hypothetical protein
MSANITYTVQPKETDADGAEFDYPQYQIESTDTKRLWQIFGTTSTGLISLNSTTGHHLIELQCDQDVDFIVTGSTGNTWTFGSVRNLIINVSTAVVNTYQIRNVSGTTANIVWRQYV